MRKTTITFDRLFSLFFWYSIFVVLYLIWPRRTWEVEAKNMLSKTIPIGTPRKKVDVWLKNKRIGYVKRGQNITIYLDKTDFKNQNGLWFDSVQVELEFDGKDALSGYGNYRNIQLAMS
jgi:hypothetical protein